MRTNEGKQRGWVARQKELQYKRGKRSRVRDNGINHSAAGFPMFAFVS